MSFIISVSRECWLLLIMHIKSYRAGGNLIIPIFKVTEISKRCQFDSPKNNANSRKQETGLVMEGWLQPHPELCWRFTSFTNELNCWGQAPPEWPANEPDHNSETLFHHGAGEVQFSFQGPSGLQLPSDRWVLPKSLAKTTQSVLLTDWGFSYGDRKEKK